MRSNAGHFQPLQDILSTAVNDTAEQKIHSATLATSAAATVRIAVCTVLDRVVLISLAVLTASHTKGDNRELQLQGADYENATR